MSCVQKQQKKKRKRRRRTMSCMTHDQKSRLESWGFDGKKRDGEYIHSFDQLNTTNNKTKRMFQESCSREKFTI